MINLLLLIFFFIAIFIVLFLFIRIVVLFIRYEKEHLKKTGFKIFDIILDLLCLIMVLMVFVFILYEIATVCHHIPDMI